MHIVARERVLLRACQNTKKALEKMKRLLIALVAAVAVSTGFARLTDTQSFEESFSDFAPSAQNEDASELVAYNNDGPDFDAPYNFENFGSKYLALDTGDATLWRTNAGDAAYFDMVMQFNPSATAPELDDDTKIAIYLNSSSNLVVLAGDGAGGTVTNVTGTTLAPGTWGRLTIASVADGFKVTLNTNTVVGTFASLKGDDKTIKAVGFKGSGALDDFVARTTDPFFQNPAATIGGEGYASFADALADDPTATIQLEANASMPAPLAYGESISVKLNNHTLSGITTGSLIALESTSGDVTTYTANYFPRTATAGQDGSAEHPYEIYDADDLVALQDAILADAANGTTFASKSYVQTANIDMTGVADFYGIGWFDSSTSFASVPSGVASDGKTALPFAGTYNGQGYTNSNVTIVKHSYAGVFNNVSGTVKNLTVQDIGLSGTCTEWGCAIVGNASNGALLENLTAVTSTGFNWGNSANHNVAGIVVRPFGAATIRGCVNNANISSTSKRLGGIASFVGSKVEGTVFDSCTNNATLVSTDGTRGVGGILGCAEGGLESGPTAAATIIRNCADFGSETAQGSGGHAGAIVGSNWNTVYTYTDDGGNTFKASTADCGYVKNAVFGRAYAVAVTISEDNYLTTVKQADLAARNTYTLLADVAASETPVFTLAEASDTIAFDTAKGFTFAGTVAVDRTKLMPATSETVGTVTTYSTTAGVASVNDVAYANFDDAVAAAVDQSTYVKLLGDVEYVFANAITLSVDINEKVFSVTYADGVIGSHSQKDGLDVYTVQKVVATVGTDKFATLQDAIAAAVAGETKTVDLVGAATGAVNIPDGITVELSNAEVNLLTSVSSLTGEGVISASAGNFNSSFYTDHAAALFAANVWQGTAAIDTVSLGEDALSYYGNAGSTVRLKNVSVNRNLGNITGKSNNVKALELAGYLRFSGLDKDTTIPCELIGNGPIEVTDGSKKLVFTGDVSEYTGSITLSSSNCQVNFGGSTTTSAGSIIVESGSVVTNASGATWTASNLIVAGEMVADGTINLGSSGKLWCNTGTGVYRANTTAAAVPVASSWNSTYVIGWTGATDKAIAFNTYGNATSTIEIPEGSTLQGYVDVTANNTLTNAVKELKVNGVLNLSNGYDYSTVVWKKISGSGTVKYAFTPSHWIKEKIISLDGFTGSIEVSATTQLEIEGVNVATQPADGARVVPMTVTAGGTVGTDVPLYVGGANAGTLTYEASGASGEGLYYHTPVYDVNFFKDAGKTEKIGDTQSVVSGEKATAPAAPTKTGYTFTGWDPDTNAEITVATDFVAQWSANTYTITYKTADGEAFSSWKSPYTPPASFTVEATETLPVAANVALTGGTFNGWTNAVGQTVTDTANLTENLVVFANVTGAATNWATDPETIAENASAAEVYSELTGSALESTDAKKLTVWAKEVGHTTVGAVAEAAVDSDLYDAYLLDCSEAELEDAKAAFAIPSITFEDGKPVIAAPEGSYNGKIQQKGSNDLSTWTVIDGSTNKAEDFQFFKLELVP